MANPKLLRSAAQDGTAEHWTSKPSERCLAAHTQRSNQRKHKGSGPSSWPSGSEMSGTATWILLKLYILNAYHAQLPCVYEEGYALATRMVVSFFRDPYSA